MRESASVCASSLPPSLHRVHRAYARASAQPHLLGRVLRGCERESTRERERERERETTEESERRRKRIGGGREREREDSIRPGQSVTMSLV